MNNLTFSYEKIANQLSVTQQHSEPQNLGDFSALPHEVISEIFKWMGSASLIETARVCRTFNILAPVILRTRIWEAPASSSLSFPITGGAGGGKKPNYENPRLPKGIGDDPPKKDKEWLKFPSISPLRLNIADFVPSHSSLNELDDITCVRTPPRLTVDVLNLKTQPLKIESFLVEIPLWKRVLMACHSRILRLIEKVKGLFKSLFNFSDSKKAE